MRNAQGYYSLVQYSEVPERAEFVNIGVILFADAPHHVLTKFTSQSKRAKRFFGVNPGKHFQYLQQSLDERLKNDFGKGWNPDEIRSFISMRSGKVRLTPVRSILVKDPSHVLTELFSELVDDDVPVAKRAQSAKSKLTKAFKDRGVDGLLTKPNPINLAGGIKIEAPFAYQNGAYNLIDAVSLSGDPDQALNRASPFMIEGELLFEETAQADQKCLVIVGDDSEDVEPGFVGLLSDRMQRHHVKFFTMKGLDILVDDIRENHAKLN